MTIWDWVRPIGLFWVWMNVGAFVTNMEFPGWKVQRVFLVVAAFVTAVGISKGN